MNNRQLLLQIAARMNGRPCFCGKICNNEQSSRFFHWLDILNVQLLQLRAEHTFRVNSTQQLLRARSVAS